MKMAVYPLAKPETHPNASGNDELTASSSTKSLIQVLCWTGLSIMP